MVSILPGIHSPSRSVAELLELVERFFAILIEGGWIIGAKHPARLDLDIYPVGSTLMDRIQGYRDAGHLLIQQDIRLLTFPVVNQLTSGVGPIEYRSKLIFGQRLTDFKCMYTGLKGHGNIFHECFLAFWQQVHLPQGLSNCSPSAASILCTMQPLSESAYSFISSRAFWE